MPTPLISTTPFEEPQVSNLFVEAVTKDHQGIDFYELL